MRGKNKKIEKLQAQHIFYLGVGVGFIVVFGIVGLVVSPVELEIRTQAAHPAVLVITHLERLRIERIMPCEMQTQSIIDKC